MFEVYNDLVWVTLCRLQGPLNLSLRGAGAYNRLTRAAPPKGAIGDTAAARTHKGSPPLHLPHVVAVDISELPCPRDGIGSPRRGQAVEVAAVVAIRNPDGLAIGEAGGRGEAHGLGVGCFEILQGQGAGVNTLTRPGTPRSQPAPLPCAHSRRRSQRGTSAWRQTPERCAMPRCR